MSIAQISFSPIQSNQDIVKISRTKDGKTSVNLNARLYRFIDKDTKQIILNIPALGITSYGENEPKAIQMLNFSIDNFFEFIVSLSRKQQEHELQKLGFSKVSHSNKEFSKSHVDSDGDLQNFNANAEEVQLLSVVA
jgi:hypothetical protein